MKRLLAILLCLSQPSWAALGFVGRVQGGGSASASTIAAPSTSHTSGNLIVALMTDQVASNVSSVTDTALNTYTQAGSEFNSGSNYYNIYYSNSITGNAGNVVTANLTGASGYRSIVVYEISGQATSSVLNTTSSGSGNSGSLATGTITLAAASEIICSIAVGNPTISTAGGYTVTNFGVTGDATAYFADGYHITSSNEAAQMAMSPSGGWAIFAASFKGAAASGGALAPQRLLQGVGK